VYLTQTRTAVGINEYALPEVTAYWDGARQRANVVAPAEHVSMVRVNGRGGYDK
jgi:hypothetical protein